MHIMLLTPFYIVELGFTAVHIIFLLFAKNIDCGEAVLTSSTNLFFEQKYEKYQTFDMKTFSFWW